MFFSLIIYSLKLCFNTEVYKRLCVLVSGGDRDIVPRGSRPGPRYDLGDRVLPEPSPGRAQHDDRHLHAAGRGQAGSTGEPVGTVP